MDGWRDRPNGQLYDEDGNKIAKDTMTDEATLRFVMAKPTVNATVNWQHPTTGKIFSDQQVPVPYQQEYWYDLKIGQ